MKTIEQQNQLMALHWPDFSVSERSTDVISWTGHLRGIDREYLIKIWHRDFVFGMDPKWQFPRVQVLYPYLQPNPRATEERPLPHVYFHPNDLTLSPLCLFDPEQNEWSHADYIALTTVKWSADWLACYEGWLATGRWYGGGRHQGEQLRDAA